MLFWVKRGGVVKLHNLWFSCLTPDLWEQKDGRQSESLEAKQSLRRQRRKSFFFFFWYCFLSCWCHVESAVALARVWIHYQKERTSNYDLLVLIQLKCKLYNVCANINLAKYTETLITCGEGMRQEWLILWWPGGGWSPWSRLPPRTWEFVRWSSNQQNTTAKQYL